MFLYPNPNDGNMKVEYTLPENETGEFEVYDWVGKKQLTFVLQGGQNIFTISERQLTKGVYFYRLVSRPVPNLFRDGNVLQQGKIVIFNNQ